MKLAVSPQRRYRRLFAGVACVLGLSAGGCGSSRPIRYHSMELPARSAHGDPVSPVAMMILVGHFTAPHIYREDKLVYRTGDTELHTYESQRWAEPPTEMLERMIVQSLRDSGRFRNVQSQRSKSRGDFVLRGHLLNFEEINGSSTRVRLEVELYDPSKGMTVWSQAYAENEPVRGKSMDAIVLSLQQATDRTVASVTAGIIGFLAAHPSP